MAGNYLVGLELADRELQLLYLLRFLGPVRLGIKHLRLQLAHLRLQIVLGPAEGASLASHLHSFQLFPQFSLGLLCGLQLATQVINNGSQIRNVVLQCGSAASRVWQHHRLGENLRKGSAKLGDVIPLILLGLEMEGVELLHFSSHTLDEILRFPVSLCTRTLELVIQLMEHLRPTLHQFKKAGDKMKGMTCV